MKKKIYRILDIMWRIIGGLILILLIYCLIKIDQGAVIDKLFLIIIILLLSYAIISIIVFLPPMLIKFFKRLKKAKRK